MTKVFEPKGSFDLIYQNKFFNGWPMLSDNRTIVMVFPIDGTDTSAAVTINQMTNGNLAINVISNSSNVAEEAVKQALAALSLDEDGTGWQNIGEKDSVIRELQEKYNYIRPSLFNSPYEAAVHFIIGHRISMVQGRKIRQNIAEEYGQEFVIEGTGYFAFPSPEKLLKVQNFPGINSTKMERLHSVARAAIEGKLSREYLLSMEGSEALKYLESLPGIGPFFSQGILSRGAGGADNMTHDDLTYHAISVRYKLGDNPTEDQIFNITDRWRPYRMWAIVLHHIWLRESGNLPKRTFSKK